MIDQMTAQNEALKQQITIFNELYVQNSMEYQALADLVGVKIQDTPEPTFSGENESAGQNISSGMISARRKARDDI